MKKKNSISTEAEQFTRTSWKRNNDNTKQKFHLNFSFISVYNV